MRAIGFGLAAAIIGAALATGVMSAAPPAKKEAITEAQRKQGMAEAPAIAQGAGIDCKVSDARFVGKNTDPKTKVATSFYEIACDQGEGFVLSAPVGAKTTAFTCVEANFPPDGKPVGLTCALPGNADPKVGLMPLLAKGGVTTCTPDATRGIGQSSTNTFIEVSCAGGGGYILQAGSPAVASAPVTANDCLLFDQGGGNIKCALHDAASRLAIVDTYIKTANNGCAIKDRRYVGLAQSGAAFFEAACQDGKGYMLEVDKGVFAKAIPCEKAAAIMGGCDLVNAKEAETAQAGLYTKLAKAAGFNCDVSKYAPFPSADQSKDIVEMACSNRPDGAVGVFGAAAKDSKVYDCGRAPIVGYRCSFSKPVYDSVTADLKKLGKSDCVVSETRLIGKTAKGTTLVETACSDGLKGWEIEYDNALTPLNVTGCAFSKDCKLKGNI
jgi:hypothetical protein